MLLRDHGPHPLCLAVVGVVVAGRERVGAEHDPALRLVAEAGVARLLVHLANVGAVDPQPVAGAVVPGQVRGSLGGSDEVVAGEPELDRAREARLPHLGAELAAELDRPVDRVLDAWLDSLRLVQLARDADADALQVLALRDLDRLGQLDGRRVARIPARHDAVEQRVVADRLRHRADLVEARRERDDPVARDGSVGRAQADDPAERGRLLDGAAGVGAERPRCEARGDRSGRAAGRSARNALGVPRVARRAEGGVLRRRAHRELVHVRLAEQRQARPRGSARPPSSRTQGRTRRGSSTPLSSRRPSS